MEVQLGFHQQGNDRGSTPELFCVSVSNTSRAVPPFIVAFFPLNAQEHLPAGPDTLICLCGPKPMIDYACMPNLKALGFSEDNVLIF